MIYKRKMIYKMKIYNSNGNAISETIEVVADDIESAREIAFDLFLMECYADEAYEDTDE